MQLRATSKIMIPVTKCSAQELSDHAPLRISLSTKQQLPKDKRPIPKWLAKHPIFKQVLLDLEKRENLDELAPQERWTRHKAIIREASETALKRCLAKVATTNDEKLQVLLQAARALRYDQPHMLPKIIKSLPCLKGVIGIDAYGHVIMLNGAKFQTTIFEVMNVGLDSEVAENNGIDGRPLRNGRSQMLDRWVKLWAPFDRRLIIYGIELPDGSLAVSPPDKANALAGHWGSFFAKKEINTRLAEAVTRRYSTELDVSGERFPGDDDFIAYWKRAKHSATGPDGIPYCAWAASGLPAACTMRLLLWDLMAGESAPEGFNDSYAIFFAQREQDRR